jgi:hypothetical protein
VNQMTRWIIPVMLLLSLAGNAYLVLSRIQSRMGGGRNETSPDGVHHASAKCLREINSLNPEKGKIWAELSIERRNDQRIQLIVTPPGTNEEMAYREREDLIRWSQDSKTVTFRLPNATISVEPNEG